jgi:hypothetical protein
VRVETVAEDGDPSGSSYEEITVAEDEQQTRARSRQITRPAGPSTAARRW